MKIDSVEYLLPGGYAPEAPSRISRGVVGDRTGGVEGAGAPLMLSWIER
jgi:hypothetical protein